MLDLILCVDHLQLIHLSGAVDDMLVVHIPLTCNIVLISSAICNYQLDFHVATAHYKITNARRSGNKSLLKTHKQILRRNARRKLELSNAISRWYLRVHWLLNRIDILELGELKNILTNLFFYRARLFRTASLICQKHWKRCLNYD